MALFTCGLVDNPVQLLQHIHRMFIDWKARAIATQADVDIEPEEELYASLVREAGFTLPLPGISSLKELCLSKLKKSHYVFVSVFSVFIFS